MASAASSDSILTPRPPIPPSAEQKRLQSLESKLQSQLSTTRTLFQRQLSLTLQLLALTPNIPPIVVDSYKPSTSAHSTPSSMPKLSEHDQETVMKDAKEVIKRHIQRLHRYNEVKDVAQGLMGMVAEARDVRVGELYEHGEFGVDEKD